MNQFSRKTCLLVAVEHGTYRLADGTRRYRHISGRGTYTSRVWAVFRRNARGRCSQSKPPRAYQQVINARGAIHGVAGAWLPTRWAAPRRSACWAWPARPSRNTAASRSRARVNGASRPGSGTGWPLANAQAASATRLARRRRTASERGAVGSP